MDVKTIIPSTRATIMIVGEAPGEVEEKCGMPFVGSDGTTLRKILTQAGIFYGECIITNTSCRRIKTFFLDKKQENPTPDFALQIARLKDEIETLNPNIIVALGAIPLRVLTGLSGLKALRGTIVQSSLVPGKKVLVTYHPKAVTYDWSLFYQSVMDFRKVRHESLNPEFREYKAELKVAPGKQDILQYLDFLYENRKEFVVAIDLEHLTPGAHISWFGISHNENFGMSVRFIENRVQCFPEMDEVEIWASIAKLCSSGIKLVFHNASYDVMNLWHNQGVWCENIHFDTLLSAHVLWPEFPKDLGYLCSILLNVPAWKHTSGNQYEHGEYNAQDAANTRALYDKMSPLIAADENYKVTFEREMAQIELAGYMQLRGVEVDPAQKEALHKEFFEKMTAIETGLSTILKKEIHFSSPKQMQELLYVDMGLPVQYKRRKSADDPRVVTTDAEALEKLYIATQDPVLKLLLEYRKYNKILQSINIELSPENKAHTSYNISGTETGRWSSSKSIILDYGSGNLQNVDRRVRKMYRGPANCRLIQADYIGAEAHVVSHLIQDHKVIKAFDDGTDIHKLTASIMFNVPYDEVTPELRTIGKTIRHATNYSAGPAVLQSKLKVTLKVAKEYLTRFQNATPQLALWHEKLRAKLSEDRILVTPLGRKRIFMDRWGDQLFRSAYAFVPQSTIGDLLNISMTDFYEKNKTEKGFGLWMQLHDAIYVWYDQNLDPVPIAQKMLESMHRPIKLPHIDLYIGVDFKEGENWKEMEGLKI